MKKKNFSGGHSKSPSIYYMEKTDGTGIPMPMNRMARKMLKSKDEPWVKPKVGPWTDADIAENPTPKTISKSEKKRLEYLKRNVSYPVKRKA